MISKEELQKFKMSLYNPNVDVRIIWAQNNTLDEIEKYLDILRILKENVISYDSNGFIDIHIPSERIYDYIKKEWLEDETDI